MKKADYDFYKSLGICVRCHKENAEPGRVMCYECQDKESEINRRSRERNLEREKTRDLDKYYRLKVEGICTYCKRRPADPGKTKCNACLAKIRNRRNAKREDIERSERPSYGICYICGKNPLYKNFKVCESCYQVRRKSIDECLEKRPLESMEYFRSLNKLVFAKTGG